MKNKKQQQKKKNLPLQMPFVQRQQLLLLLHSPAFNLKNLSRNAKEFTRIKDRLNDLSLKKRHVMEVDRVKKKDSSSQAPEDVQTTSPGGCTDHTNPGGCTDHTDHTECTGHAAHTKCTAHAAHARFASTSGSSGTTPESQGAILHHRRYLAYVLAGSKGMLLHHFAADVSLRMVNSHPLILHVSSSFRAAPSYPLRKKRLKTSWILPSSTTQTRSDSSLNFWHCSGK